MTGDYKLMQGEKLLGMLHRCEIVEMFWMHCEFSPQEEFAIIAPLFRKAWDEVDEGEFERLYDEIMDQGIFLIGPNGNRLDEFFLHIDVENRRAHLRI
ncbi:MAG: hypothetical protein RLP44_05570 [Aggregatilineales bacterium]